MKTIAGLVAATAALAAAGATPGTASAADFVTIPLETTVNAPAEAAWKKISGSRCLFAITVPSP